MLSLFEDLKNWWKKITGSTPRSVEESVHSDNNSNLIQGLKNDLSQKEQELSLLLVKLEKKEGELNAKENELNTKRDELSRIVTQQSSIPIEANNEGQNLLQKQIIQKDEDIKNLKKQLLDKDDLIDDREFELSLVQKKIEASKKELSDLKNCIAEIEDSYKSTQQELEMFKQKASDQQLELDFKTLSISMIDEILKSPQISEDFTEENHSNVNKIKSYINEKMIEDLRQNFSNFISETIKDINNKAEKWANLQLKTWLNEKTVIAFVGEFSAGKTSIVNRILSQNIEHNTLQLPVSVMPTTAIPTYISYGKNLHIQFITPDGKIKIISANSFSLFSKNFLNELNLSALVKYFVIKYENENLKNLSILDTPGFSSNDKEDEKRTSEVIRESDALFWVLDANTGEINDKSVQIIKEHLKGITLNVILNKVDTKSPNERAEILKKVRLTLENNSIPVNKYLEFSKDNSVTEIMEVINSIKRKIEDNFIEYVVNLLNTYIESLKALINKQQGDKRKYEKQQTDLLFQIDNETDKINSGFTSLNFKTKEMESIVVPTTILGIKTGSHKIENLQKFWNLFNERNEDFNAISSSFQQIIQLREQIIDINNSLNTAKNNIELNKKKLDLLRSNKTHFQKICSNEK